MVQSKVPPRSLDLLDKSKYSILKVKLLTLRNVKVPNDFMAREHIQALIKYQYWLHRFQSRSWLAPVCSSLALASCASAIQPYQPPSTSHLHADNFKSVIALETLPTSQTHQDWWLSLNDTVLATLVTKAIENNKDIQAASYRVTAARMGEAAQSRTSKPVLDIEFSNSFFGESNNAADGLTSRSSVAKSFLQGIQANGLLSWEYDLLGRIRAEQRVTQTETEITEESRRDIMQVVANEVTVAYIDFRGAESQLKILDEIRSKREESLSISKVARQMGIITDYEEKRLQFESTELNARLTEVERLRSDAYFRLEALIGEQPVILNELARNDGDFLNGKLDILLQSPAEVIRQRPDIRIAERQLAAATYQIGIVATEYYPRISLFGGIDPLSSNPLSLSQSLGFSIRDHRLVGARVGQQKATTQAALANFDAVVLRALSEVEIALVALSSSKERVRSLSNRLATITATRDKMREMLDAGVATLPEFKEVEIEVLEINRELEEAKATSFVALVQVYRAFGGGFQEARQD